MFLEELGEGGDRNIECVGAIVLFQTFYLGSRRDTL